MEIIRTKTLEIYVTRKGSKPFVNWIESLKDSVGRYRIKERLERVSLGNLGDYRTLQAGVSELRLAFGPGYRIYFGEVPPDIILLLCGGDKTTQTSDIKKAIIYWQHYWER